MDRPLDAPGSRDEDMHIAFITDYLGDCAAALDFGAEKAPTGRGYRNRALETFVYFIAWEGGPIKIGFTNNLIARLQCLQTASPYALRILGAFPGTESDERRLHAKYAHCRLLNEWFERCPEIESEIASLTTPAPIGTRNEGLTTKP